MKGLKRFVTCIEFDRGLSMKGLVEDTLKVIDEMFYSGEAITFFSVCEKADVSRKFLYNHKEIRDKISFYRNFNSLNEKERLNKLNNQNQKLIKRLNRYEDALIEVINIRKDI